VIVELLVTCTLMKGQTFHPPAGWSVRAVQAFTPSAHCTNVGGSIESCIAINVSDHEVPTSVTLARSAEAWETITPPPGCESPNTLTITPGHVDAR